MTAHWTLPDAKRPGLQSLDGAALDTIEAGADRVLAEIGIRFQDDPATLDVLAGIGGQVSGDVVRLNGAILRRIVRATAPARFTLRGRNPARDTPIGGNAAPVFAPIYGAPDVLHPDGRRTSGTRAIYRTLVELTHAAPSLANTGHMLCVTDDVPEAARPFAMLHDHLSLSDKPFMGTIATPEAAQTFISLTQAAVARPPAPGTATLLHLINCTPPLTYWPNPLRCLRVIAEAGEASLVSSYAMMGATSPVTVAGTLIQGYAEVLAGLALTQLWRPGAPVVMGMLGYPFDMRSMVPVFGDPATQLVQLYAAGLATRLGVPVRSDGAFTSAKLDDAQAGYESARGLATATATGASFVLHSAGWLHQGRCVSIAKFSRDAAHIAATVTGAQEPSAPPSPLDRAIEQAVLRQLTASVSGAT